MISGTVNLLIFICVFAFILKIKTFRLAEIICVSVTIVILYPTVNFLDKNFPSAVLEFSVICVLAPSVEEFIRYFFRRKDISGTVTVRSISVVMGALDALVKLLYTNIYFLHNYALQDKISIHSLTTTINTILFHVNIGLFWEKFSYNKSNLRATLYCIIIHSLTNFILIGAEPPSLYGKLYFVFVVLLLESIVFIYLIYFSRKTQETLAN
ncbi:hypothetical protein AB0K68_52665, partial [Streptomyces sp. NPDC050698]